MNKVNEKGIELLHDFEKLRFRAYDDAQSNVVLTEKTVIKGHLTIGWGRTLANGLNGIAKLME